MARSSKWIRGTKPDQPVTEVARQVVLDRLSTVWHFAPLAAKHHDDDIEYVHQLRVATRRARAALKIFADLLPKRKARWMKKELSALRRSAGDARDLDVFGARLETAAAEKQDSCLRDIGKRITKKRRQAQKPVAAAYKQTKRKGFKKRARALVKSIRWQGEPPEPCLAHVARTTLARLVDDFFFWADADLSDTHALHQMRISGKQVRYAMEMLAGALDESFLEQLYPIFEEVQDKLGTINDHATAITMYNEWFQQVDYSRGRAELAELLAKEEQLLDLECESFRSWWTARRAAELKHRFADVLSVRTATIPASWALPQQSPQLSKKKTAANHAAGPQEEAQYKSAVKASTTV